MIHTTVGVYKDGSMKSNGVKSEDLANHLSYNLTMRRGRALFLDGFCIHQGNLSNDELEDAKTKLPEAETQDTRPYQ